MQIEFKTSSFCILWIELSITVHMRLYIKHIHTEYEAHTNAKEMQISNVNIKSTAFGMGHCSNSDCSVEFGMLTAPSVSSFWRPVPISSIQARDCMFCMCFRHGIRIMHSDTHHISPLTELCHDKYLTLNVGAIDFSHPWDVSRDSLSVPGFEVVQGFGGWKCCHSFATERLSWRSQHFCSTWRLVCSRCCFIYLESMTQIAQVLMLTHLRCRCSQTECSDTASKGDIPTICEQENSHDSLNILSPTLSLFLSFPPSLSLSPPCIICA